MRQAGPLTCARATAPPALQRAPPSRGAPPLPDRLPQTRARAGWRSRSPGTPSATVILHRLWIDATLTASSSTRCARMARRDPQQRGQCNGGDVTYHGCALAFLPDSALFLLLPQNANCAGSRSSSACLWQVLNDPADLREHPLLRACPPVVSTSDDIKWPLAALRPAPEPVPGDLVSQAPAAVDFALPPS